jgi:2-hydroxymuconate-semialdehyde hydrolase
VSESNPEIGKSIEAGGYATNYHDIGSGPAVVFVHGSGPGVSAWANWRLAIPDVSQKLRVIAPDMVGFGFSDRPDGVDYSMETWVAQLIGLLDALKIEKTHLVGNSFGAALSLQVAIRQPERVDRLVLMGAMGVHAPLPAGLNAVWGYEPSRENMRELVNLFAYNKAFATDDLIEMRYNASVRPGFQESFHAMCSPVGHLPSIRPAGTDAAGWPVKFSGKVRHQPMERLSATPSNSAGPSVLPSVALSTGRLRLASRGSRSLRGHPQ